MVIQNDVANRSALATVITCALTSDVQRASAPGNVLLDPRETSLAKPSVVNVSQVVTVDKRQLDEHVVTLSRRRVHEILSGLRLLTERRDGDP